MYLTAVNPVCAEQAPKVKILRNRAVLKARINEIRCRNIRSTLNALQPSSSEGVEQGNKVGMGEMMNRYVCLMLLKRALI